MNFDYEIKDDDDSIKSVKTDERFYNYIPTSLNNFDESYEELYHQILDDDDIVYNYLYPKKNFDKKYVLDSIKLWNDLGITLHNINIFKKLRNGNHVVLYDFGPFSSFKKKDVSDLKVKFKNIPQWDSKVTLKEIDEKNYKDVVFNQILLPKVEKKLASTIYAHEISHTQLLNVGGGLISIFNEETIPIFMEFVFADKLDNSKETLSYVNNERLVCVSKFINNLSLGNRISYEERVKCEKYIISSLHAMELFKIYYYSNDNLKKEMLNDIKKIFNGEEVVERMLVNYDINHNYIDKSKSLKFY